MRIFATLLLPPPSNDYMAPSFFQGIALLVYLAAQTVLGVSFLVLNGQRLEQELLQSIEECKVLRGIIPICAYCKKIRNDEGAWDQVEHYIRKHTDATFSHGICPECAAVEREKIAERRRALGPGVED